MQYMLMIIGDESWKQQPPEVLMEVMKGHQALQADLTAAGKFVGGSGLGPGADARTVRRNGDGQFTVTDGPYAETKEIVGGYYVVESESMDEAIDWAKRIPSSVPNAVEIRQLGH